MHYTGIGSRKTPPDILLLMEDIAKELCLSGFELYSGGAEGADRAFEKGAISGFFNEENKQTKVATIFIPWEGHSSPISSTCTIYLVPGDDRFDEAAEEISDIVPWFDSMSYGAKKRHARNVWQVLGASKQCRSQFVVYWTPGDPKGGPTGGTRTAVLLAQRYGIPTYHVGDPEQLKALYRDWL